MPKQPYKPKIVSVRSTRPTESFEDEAPRMASPITTMTLPTEAPLVIVLRPSWLDLPAGKLAGRLTLIGICSLPGLLIITAVIHTAWKLL